MWSLYGDDGKLAPTVLGQLGDAGYWGTLVDKRYGGCGLPFQHFAPFLTRMATIEPTIAGLASVHGCIGAVDPVRTFGTAAQKERYLPLLASGRRLSAFALTEPGAGSDLTALKTTAVLDGDSYVVNGEIVIRPMMYLALSYDHRIVDGKGAVTFLVRVKEALEDPRRVVMDL